MADWFGDGILNWLRTLFAICKHKSSIIINASNCRFLMWNYVHIWIFAAYTMRTSSAINDLYFSRNSVGDEGKQAVNMISWLLYTEFCSMLIFCFLLTSFSHSQPVTFILFKRKQIWSCRRRFTCSQSRFFKSGCTSLYSHSHSLYLRWIVVMLPLYEYKNSWSSFASHYLDELKQIDCIWTILEIDFWWTWN